MPPNPWFSWEYVTTNWSELMTALGDHALISIQAVLLATVCAVPLALLAHEVRWLSGPIVAVAGILYTVPSLALFAMLVPFTGIGHRPVLIGLVMYALLIMIRTIMAGLASVDPALSDAARGMGFGRMRQLLTVVAPQAIPSAITGLRLASVSTVALVTVGYIAGFGGLGTVMFRGFAANYRAQIVTATVLVLLLAAIFDVIIATIGRISTPWLRGVTHP